jgi:hypothetical protein
MAAACCSPLTSQVLRVASHKLGVWAGGHGAGESVPLIRKNWTACAQATSQAGGAPSQAGGGPRALCLLEHASWATLGGALRAGRLPTLAHLIRDPVEVCVSGYQVRAHANHEPG